MTRGSPNEKWKERKYWIVLILIGFILPIVLSCIAYFTLFKEVMETRRSIHQFGERRPTLAEVKIKKETELNIWVVSSLNMF